MSAAARGTKRAALSSDSAISALRAKVVEQLASVLDKSADEITAAIAAKPDATFPSVPIIFLEYRDLSRKPALFTQM